MRLDLLLVDLGTPRAGKTSHKPFGYYQYGQRVVHLDGCLEVEAAYYGLPPGWIGPSVKVYWDALHVCILHPTTDQLLREHVRQKRGGYRIEEEDHPKKMPLSTAQLHGHILKCGPRSWRTKTDLPDQGSGENGINKDHVTGHSIWPVLH